MKKSLLSVFLFTCACVSAQVINIPDGQFKYKLLQSNTYQGVARDANNNPFILDVNGDGEIQVSEAQNIHRLIISQQGISDLTGTTSFSNLEYIYCTYNYGLAAVDLSGLTHLQEINFSNNYNVASINLTGDTALTKISVAHTLVSSLDLSTCTSLNYIDFQSGALASLDVSMLTGLIDLHLFNNNLTAIDVSMLTGLKSLTLSENNLTTLDVSANTQLRGLYCDENQLTFLNVTGCNALEYLRCNENQLVAVDLDDKPLLVNFMGYNNPFTALDFSDCTALTYLDINTTLISTLDLRYQPVTELHISHCPQLTSLFIKNNSFDFGGESQYYFEDIYLTSVCADEEEFTAVQDLLNSAGLTNVALTSDCALETPAATNQFDLARVKIFPNPASDKVTINAGSLIKTISLYDIQGRLLLSSYPENTAASIDILAQPAGVYLIKITTETGSITKKMLKE